MIFNSKTNQYFIGVHRVLDLVKQYGTPAYLYDLATIRERVLELRQNLGVYPKTEFLYAIKANYNPHLVREIIDLGFGIDAVSPEEVKIGLACGARPENIMFTGNNMTDVEMAEVHGFGILLNIGSLSRLKKYGERYPGGRVCVRFNPNIGAASHETNITGGPHSKFGISFADVDLVLSLARRYRLSIVGIHQHIGSGWLGTREPLLALGVILDLAAQIPGLQFIDVGGGFGVPYQPGQGRLDLPTLGREISRRFTEFCEVYGRCLTLRFEPGRYVVAESGDLLTTVTSLKTSISGKTIVGTDTGMNHLVRVAMYDAYHPIINVSHPHGEPRPYDVTGNICECADFFAHDRSLPKVNEGDVLAITIAGAYGFAMASNYQFRPFPIEILVDGGRLRVIRPRQSFAERFAVYGLPTHLSLPTTLARETTGC